MATGGEGSTPYPRGGTISAVTLTERLNRLDEAVLPQQRRYDRTQPVWFVFGGMLGSVIGIMVGLVAVHTDGVWRIVLLTLLLTIVAGYTASSWRWQREHRLPKR